MAPKKTTTKKEITKKFRVQAKAGLLTYNETEIETEADLEEMRTELKAKFKHDISLSLCVEKESRLHNHVFYESETVIDCDLSFFETKKSGKVGDFKPNRGKNVDRGHWYVQCEWKKSHIASITDKKVKAAPKWLMDEWKNNKIEKITDGLAAEKLLTPQLQLQISAVTNYQEKQEVEKLVEERKARLVAKLEVFAPIPDVTSWKSTFEVELERYPFLVLCGPSKMRKTIYAKSLFKNPFVHKDKIDWDGYSWLKNDCIIFDDINLPDHIWKYVRQNKVLFQASSTVAVNTSATNCYKRDICIVQRPIIICSNDGLIEKYVTETYKEWILANCLWVEVTKPIRFMSEPEPSLYYQAGNPKRAT